MKTHRIFLAVRFAVTSIVLCWLLASCGGAPPWLTRPPVRQPSPTPSKVPPRVVTPRGTSSVPSPFWLEDTQLELSSGAFYGRGNLTWSPKGDQLVYLFAYSLRVVPDNQWNRPREVYTLIAYSGPLSMMSGHLVGTPRAATVGLTVIKNDGSLNPPPEYYVSQVDWEQQVLSYLSLDQAILIDWSPAYRIVARRWQGGDDSWWVYDVPTLTWNQVVIPESISAKYRLIASQWATADSLLWLGDTDPDWKQTFADFAVFSLDWPSGQWEMLPPQIKSAHGQLPFPAASPDGRWIAWIEDRLPYSRLMLYDREKGEQIEAANSLDYGQILWGDLTWAPDSKRLAFSSERAGDEQQRHIIWILHLDPLT